MNNLNNRSTIVILATYLTAALFLGALSACSKSTGSVFSQADQTTTNAENPRNKKQLSYGELKSGDCATPVDEATRSEQVQLVDCNKKHKLEVIGSTVLSDSDYPGYVALLDSAYEACQPQFQAYTGHSVYKSEFDLDMHLPSKNNWSAGDRTVTCLLVHADRKMMTTAARQ